jgi:hypothetical protein
MSCVAAPEPSPTSSPSVNAVFGYLTVLAILYTLLAAYWVCVFPGGNGAPHKFYFFLLPSYWLAPTPDDDDDDNITAGVVVKDVKKVYGEFEALKGVSLVMERGEGT